MRLSAMLLTAGTLGLAGFSGGCYETFPGQGITNDYRSYVPMSADSVATGTGDVSYIAAMPGTVYLIDHNRSDQLKPGDDKHYAPHVIGTALLQKGQAITVDGGAQTITVGGTGNVAPTVFMNPNLSPDNSYELRIDPDTKPE